MTNLLTTNEVVKISKFSRATLNHYAKMGWIKKPTLRSYGPGQGRGSTHWWRRGVIADLVMIRMLKKAGKKNSQIDKIMKGQEQ